MTFENQVIKRLTQLPSAYPIPLLAIIFLIYYYIVIPMASMFAPFNLRLHLFTERNSFYILCGFAAAISYFLTSQLRLILIIVLPFIAWIGSFLVKGVKFSPSMLAFPILVITFFLLSLILYKNWWQRLLRSLIALLLFLASGYWMLKSSMGDLGITVVSRFWLTHPEFYILFVLVILIRKSNSSSNFLMLFPTNLIWGTIWPADAEYKKHLDKVKFKNLWWSGFYSLSVSVVLFFIAFGLRYLLADFRLGMMSTTAFYYLFFILMIVASFNVHIGISRMLGVQCPDATYFLILAKTPMEVWQRGSTYVYKFFLNFIYIPLQRKIRSYTLVMFLCLIIVVIHMFIFHDVVLRLFYMWLIPELSAPNVKVLNIFAFSMAWASVWFFWIAIGATLWRKLLIKFPKPYVQWLSIIINHIVIASILPFVELVLTPFILQAWA